MRDLALELSKSYNVTVLCPPPSRPAGFKMENNRHLDYPYEIVEVDSFTCPKGNILGRFRENISFAREANKYISKHHKNIDFIYNVCWPLFGKYLVAKKAIKYGIPFATSVQDVYPESLAAHFPDNFITRRVLKKLLKLDKFTVSKAKFIHTISIKMEEMLVKAREISTQKFVIVRNWQNEEEFISFHNRESKKKETKEDNVLTFMYMGNIGPLAGLDLVIDAFNMAGLSNTRLIIAGAGSAKDSLINKVKSNNISNVEFWDVPNGKVPEVQDKADVMVLPIKKGFGKTSIPSKLPAYMFSKKPVLASVDKESDTAECILKAEAGWVVEPENSDVLVAAFKEIHGFPHEELKLKGNNGFTFAMNNFSKANNLKKLVAAFDKVLD